jgi:hypothetical protein
MSYPAAHLPIQYCALSRVARYGTTHHGHTVLDTDYGEVIPSAKQLVQALKQIMTYSGCKAPSRFRRTCLFRIWGLGPRVVCSARWNG